MSNPKKKQQKHTIGKWFDVCNDYSLVQLPCKPADLDYMKKREFPVHTNYYNKYDELVYVRVNPSYKFYDNMQSGNYYCF